MEFVNDVKFRGYVTCCEVRTGKSSGRDYGLLEVALGTTVISFFIPVQEVPKYRDADQIEGVAELQGTGKETKLTNYSFTILTKKQPAKNAG